MANIPIADYGSGGSTTKYTGPYAPGKQPTTNPIFATNGNPPAVNTAATPSAGSSTNPLLDEVNALINAGLAQYSPGSSGSSSSYIQVGPSANQIWAQLQAIANQLQPNQDELQKQAAAQVAAALNPQEDAIRNAIAQANALYNQQYGQENVQGQQQLSDIAATFNALQNFISQATQAGQARYNAAQTAQDQGFNNLIQGIQDLYSNAKQSTGNELNRLGLTGVNTGKLTQDEAFLQGLAQANKTAAANSLSQTAANYVGNQNNFASAEQAAGATARTKTQNMIGQLLAQLTNQNNANVGTLNNQIASLEGTRQSQIQNAMTALTQQALQNIAQQQQNYLSAVNAGNSGMKQVSSSYSSPGSGISPSSAASLLLNLYGKTNPSADALLSASNKSPNGLADAMSLIQQSDPSLTNTIYNYVLPDLQSGASGQDALLNALQNGYFDKNSPLTQAQKSLIESFNAIYGGKG